jgi:hypothetical protein
MGVRINQWYSVRIHGTYSVRRCCFVRVRYGWCIYMLNSGTCTWKSASQSMGPPEIRYDEPYVARIIGVYSVRISS